jgi:hypothetical protein
MRKLCMAAAWLLAVPIGAQGQTAWDAPLLLPPQPAPGIGVYLMDMHSGGLGVLGTWRSATWNYGLRLGISDGGGNDDLAIFGGVDYNGPINSASSDFPLDLDWVLGAGLGISDGVRLSVPLGLTAGISFQSEGARFVPYITPRIILDGRFGREDRDSDLDLDVAFDIGLDVRLVRGTGPLAGRTIRFGASLGDRDALGIGIVF